MINISGKIPKEAYLAVSGGLDSMVGLDFLRRSKTRSLEVLHFNHGTAHSNDAEEFVRSKCKSLGLKLFVGKIKTKKDRRESQEEYWRRERYSFFENFNDKKIITFHHLNDQIETYIFTMLNGNEMLIPHQRDNYLRPFVLTSRSRLEDWARSKNVEYIDDPSNFNTKYSRNLIRHELIPLVKKINPGIEKVVKKKVLNKIFITDNYLV